MQRRKFLVGVGGTAIGGSALLGSGAFSRVESQRHVSIAVAEDPDAYLGITPLNEKFSDEWTKNGNNYAHLDEKGHAYLEITDSGNGGEGVNSDSKTWFDGLFEICNNGKADAEFTLDWGDVDIAENAEIILYFQHTIGGPIMAELSSDDPDGAAGLKVGTCQYMGVRTETFSVNAKEEDTIADGTLKIIADAPGAGELQP